MSNDEMSFLDHLEVLRWHLIRSTLAVVLIGFVAFFFHGYIFDNIIFAPKYGDFPTYQFFCKLGNYFDITSDFCQKELPFVIQNRTMGGQFSASIWISIWVGLVLGFPYLIYEFWKFISPALYENERKSAKSFIFVTSFLFFLGILFGYFVISPLSINFFANYSVSDSVENQIDIDSYIGILRSSVVACGILFEVPVIIYFLSRVGLVTPSFLRTYRRHAIVLVLILAAVITPPDVVSQIVVSIPIVILYELSIFICAWVVKKQKI